MIITTDALSKRIKENEDRLFLIYGEEDYFIDAAVRSIKKKYIAPDFESMDYTKLDFWGKNIALSTLTENIELPPWCSSRRVIEVVNFEFDKEATEKLPDMIARLPDSVVLVFATDKVDKRKKKLFDSFVKNGVVCESTHLEETKLMRYISTSFNKAGINIDQEAGESIISRYDSSLRRINSAIQRMILYCDATDTKLVDIDVVDQLCEPDIHGDIFKIMDAVGEGNAASALVLLDNLIKLKEPLPRIRFMIARHFRELICAKELNNKNELVSRMGARGFIADKLLRQSRNFSMDRLLKLYSLCYRNDYDLKHGEADERASLESFIVLASGK
ncbi:MAG: DNA polymerase III subunit delta [Clostridiales bacterium]|nr:DNA polymerase III subunit delta [Clostridiales bacterium]